MTVALDHWTAWLGAMRRAGLSAGTIRCRYYELVKWSPFMGERWAAADWRDVEAFTASRPLAPRAIKSAVSHLRAFYKWGRRQGVVDVDPCRDVECPRIPRRLPRPASERDVRRAVGAGRERCELACAFMAYGGFRCCEVATLEWADVDLVGRRVHVIGKGNKEAYVPIVAPLAAIVGQADGRVGRVFTTVDGRAVGAARVSQLVNAHLRRRACECTAHQLRHYAGTRMLEVEGDLLVVRDFLRHGSVAQTEGYAKLASGRVAAAAAKWR